MRYKYTFWHFHTLDYQTALTLLENYSNKGYTLRQILFGIAIFKKTENTSFNYAIDRDCFHIRYEDMGYHICTPFNKDLQIFAIDRNTTTQLPFSELEIQQHLLSTFSSNYFFSHLLFSFILFLFFAILSTSTIQVSTLASSSISLYLGINLALFILVLSSLLHVIEYKKFEVAYIRQSLYTGSTHTFHQIDKFLYTFTVFIGVFIVLSEIIDLLTSYGDSSPLYFFSIMILFVFMSLSDYLKNHLKILKKFNNTLWYGTIILLSFCLGIYEPEFPHTFNPAFLNAHQVVTLADLGIDEQPAFEKFETHSSLLAKHYYTYNDYSHDTTYSITYFESRIPALTPYIASKLAQEYFGSHMIKDLKIDGIDYGFVPEPNPIADRYILVKDNQAVYLSIPHHLSIQLKEIIDIIF